MFRFLYQGAIDFAAKYYSFSTGKFDPSLPNFVDYKVFGVTDIDGSIRYGSAALSSPSTLAATGWHETVHQDQFYQGLFYRENSFALEVHAGVDTIYNSGRLNLSSSDVQDEINYLIRNMSLRRYAK